MNPGTGTPPADPGTDPGDGGAGGGGAPPVAPEDPAASASPGSTVFARKLGGAGREVALGPLAFGTDGSFVALSLIGSIDWPDDPPWGALFPQFLGLARFDANGATQWSKTFDTGREEVERLHLAISPLGNVFVGLTAPMFTGIDLGGGPVTGSAVVKLAPDGRFVWQRGFPEVGDLAVDGSGSVVVAVGERVVKLRWDGAPLWEWVVPKDQDGRDRGATVAFDPAGNVLVTGGLEVFKLDPQGRVLWTRRVETTGSMGVVGATAKGTVVVSGRFSGSLTFGGTTHYPVERESNDFVLAIESDGRPRWARPLTVPTLGVSLDPVGRIVLLTNSSWGSDGCTDVLHEIDLTGEDVWRRRIATCEPRLDVGSFARGVGVAPSGAIWVQGDANAPFDLGTGLLTPEMSDWWLLRVAP